MSETPLQIACKRYGKNGNLNYKEMIKTYEYETSVHDGKPRLFSNLQKAWKQYTADCEKANVKPKGYSTIANQMTRNGFFFEFYNEGTFKIERREII
jgi:hypothetical protein